MRRAGEAARVPPARLTGHAEPKEQLEAEVVLLRRAQVRDHDRKASHDGQRRQSDVYGKGPRRKCSHASYSQQRNPARGRRRCSEVERGRKQSDNKAMRLLGSAESEPRAAGLGALSDPTFGMQLSSSSTLHLKFGVTLNQYQ